ncbi:NUDIX hydrolase [Blastopirellula sp. JC732]|uniref:NUDIX hydrolase n=1 Tax=Blastopirellula sediminis TaxID=2894196 RepID=A0A9X1MM26_9BACT|nr:NUDIX domain-containing protein [Blastopirellula sediminis]MCC9609229.1 NUDIX hydrolase [Blastopirellula sediminis]MCC9627994.1 NUDIX hydrolase [Blastopirellula sediminis]
MAFVYEYARPSVTVDCVIFGLDDDGLKILLIQRDAEPFEGGWALPGGFVEMGESLDQAAMRELQEETGVHEVFLEQLYTFGEVNRDPRTRVITVAYYALVNLKDHKVEAATDARAAAWFELDDLPTLAFDHDKILQMAQERLQGKVRYQPIGFELLPEKFSLRQLQRMYEIVLGRSLDKRNFRKKALSLGVLEDLNEVERDVSHRAARLYRFDREKYQQLVKDGFNFEL